MKIATWNVERLKHYKDIALMRQEIDKCGADILVLTETDNRLSPDYPYCYETPLLKDYRPDYYRDTENRVSIFSRYKCVERYETYDSFTAICVELETYHGNLLIYGTIMGIFGNREASFKTDLAKQMEDIRRFTADGENICVIGDYNLSFCDNYYYTKYGRDKVADTFSDCDIRLLTKDRAECVDHIAISDSFVGNADITMDEWNYDKALSDHKGIWVDMEW
ncbi:MAG: endonuclease/exonuclease/phosphatase family protein [Lachnospiraceae bacterium]|nr:endonuclease/exonuclease/phosphatase family protein [Lachnospiraceae bacterium]